jgi:hypothetical protein
VAADGLQVFTAITMEWMAVQGVIRVNDTLNEILKVTTTPIPRWQDPAVGTLTLRELATHTSGLPKLPSNLHGTPQNIFTGYTDADLFQFLGNLSSLPTRGSFLYVPELLPTPHRPPPPTNRTCTSARYHGRRLPAVGSQHLFIGFIGGADYFLLGMPPSE